MKLSDVRGLVESGRTWRRGTCERAARWLRAVGSTVFTVLVVTLAALLLIATRLVPLLLTQYAEGSAAASSGAAVQPCC